MAVTTPAPGIAAQCRVVTEERRAEQARTKRDGLLPAPIGVRRELSAVLVALERLLDMLRAQLVTVRETARQADRLALQINQTERPTAEIAARGRIACRILVTVGAAWSQRLVDCPAPPSARIVPWRAMRSPATGAGRSSAGRTTCGSTSPARSSPATSSSPDTPAAPAAIGRRRPRGYL